MSKKALLISLLVLSIPILWLSYKHKSIPNKTPSATAAFATSQVVIGSHVQETKIAEYCSQFQNSGSAFTFFNVPWGMVEPQKNVYDWSKLDRLVAQARQCGQEVGAYLYSRSSSWALQLPPDNTPYSGGYPASLPPLDLNDYANFIKEFVHHYQGQITRIAIENEANADIEFAGTNDQYAAMLQTAYNAAHETNPQIVVENAPLSSAAVGFLYGNYLWTTDHQAAVQFMASYFALYPPSAKFPWQWTEANLAQYLTQSEVKRAFDFYAMLIQNKAYFDVFSIHYYGPPQNLVETTNFLNKDTKKPFDFWEFGYGYLGAPDKGYDPTVNAQELLKLVTLAASQGGQRIVQFELNDHDISEGHPGVYTDTGDARQPLFDTFKSITQNFNGVVKTEKLSLASSDNQGANVSAYKFTKANSQIFTVLWSNQPSTIIYNNQSLSLSSQPRIINQ